MKTVLTILLILVNICSIAQNNEVNNLAYESHLLETSNKRVELLIKKDALRDTNLVEYKALINSIPGEILGPFVADSITFYTKTLHIDSAYKCHIGNIWISTNKGWNYAEKKAYEILHKVNAGADYDSFCKLFSEDGNQKTDCELPWTFTSSFLKPFAEAIEKHDTGQIFVVKTEFGYHVVKIIDQGKMEQKSVTYLKIIK